MFCENCGSEIDQGAEFCQNCGRKVGASSSTKQSKIDTPLDVQARDVFYSKEWRRKKVFAVVSMPYFDVLADKQYLSLIRMPSYKGQTWGLIIGLVILNIIGAIIGAILGGNSDTKKRNWYRSAWVDSNNNITSREYDRDIYIKIPIEQVKTVVVFKPNKFEVEFDGKKLVLQKSEVEVELLTNFINKHVL